MTESLHRIQCVLPRSQWGELKMIEQLAREDFWRLGWLYKMLAYGYSLAECRAFCQTKHGPLDAVTLFTICPPGALAK